MDTEMRNALSASDKEIQYDNEAKRLLGNKHILAHILVQIVEDFRGMAPKDVIPYIEGDPIIAAVPVEPGLTNAPVEERASRVVGLNTENAEIREGFIRFDIVFYVRTKDGLSQIIVNVEAQKDGRMEYGILNRAVFYVCRLVSSQKERDFTNTNYDDIKRVYSIWVCMNEKENSMSHIRLCKEDLLGSRQWAGRLDLLNIILIGLSDHLPDHDTEHALHRLLGALFSTELSVHEKLNIIESEYDIPTTGKISEGVNTMCNLSQGIRERGQREGRMEGRAEREAGIISSMYQKGYSVEQIAEVVEREPHVVQELLEKSKQP